MKDVTAYKDSKSVTLLEVVLDLVWELFWSPKSEKNTQIELWKLSPSSHPPRSLIPLLNHTTPPYPYINWSKMLMKSKLLTMKLFTISASELWNWPPQPTEILTIWSQPLCPVLHAASDSQVNWTVISESSLLTWFLSQDCISSWLVRSIDFKRFPTIQSFDRSRIDPTNVRC